MPTRYTIVCPDDQARVIESLAHEFDLTEEQVLQQLIDLGMESLDETSF